MLHVCPAPSTNKVDTPSDLLISKLPLLRSSAQTAGSSCAFLLMRSRNSPNGGGGSSFHASSSPAAHPRSATRRPSISEQLAQAIAISSPNNMCPTNSTSAQSPTPLTAAVNLYHRCHLCTRRVLLGSTANGGTTGGNGGNRSHSRKRTAVIALLIIFLTIVYTSSRRRSGHSPTTALALKLRGSSKGGKGTTVRHKAANKQGTTTHSKTLDLVNTIAPTKLSPSQLDAINSELASMTLDQVLRWSRDTFHDGLVDVTSFGYSGMVILHSLQQMGLLNDMHVVTVDTLHLFPETYDFIDRLRNGDRDVSSYDLMAKFYTYAPQGYTDRKEFDEMYGSELWKDDPDRYNYLSKVEPTMRALEELDARAWLTGRRRDQGGERDRLTILEVDSSDKSRYKINPLAHWSYEDIWKFIKENKVPYNPLHDRGYKSVGDYMTTAPVDDGAAERSGRFVGLGRTECGIHSTRKKIQKMKEEAEQAGREFEGAASLPCPECTYDITPENFDSIVINSQSEKMLLVEFYSPMCGGCQEFSPKFQQIVHALSEQAKDVIETSRFDITEYDAPHTGQVLGIDVETTPDLYILKRGGNDLKLVHFEGEHDLAAVTEWISKEIGVSISL